jgi:hypothetical protein
MEVSSDVIRQVVSSYVIREQPKLLDWISDKVDWNYLTYNPNDIYILEYQLICAIYHIIKNVIGV